MKDIKYRHPRTPGVAAADCVSARSSLPQARTFQKILLSFSISQRNRPG